MANSVIAPCRPGARAGFEPPAILAGRGIARLGDRAGPEAEAARGFCLAVIGEVYGFDYRPDWHADLDSLRAPAPGAPYASASRGFFLVLRDPGGAGAIAATAGVQALSFKPRIAARLADRYPDPSRAAHLTRVYVRRDLRGAGLGRRLTALAEREATALGYERAYLHAHSAHPSALGFWRGRGYTAIGVADDHADFDKALTAG